MANLIGLPNESTGLGAAFSCFGFLVSRLLRFWPLAMTECPFHKSGFGIIRRADDGFETILCRHPLMPFHVIADPVLRGSAFGRQRAGDAIEASRLGLLSKIAPQAHGLADGIKMRRPFAAGRTMGMLRSRWCGHDVLFFCSWRSWKPQDRSALFRRNNSGPMTETFSADGSCERKKERLVLNKKKLPRKFFLPCKNREIFGAALIFHIF